MIQNPLKSLVFLPLLVSCSKIFKPATLIVSPKNSPTSSSEINSEVPTESLSPSILPAASPSGSVAAPAAVVSSPEPSAIQKLLGPQVDDGIWIPLDLLATERKAKKHVGAPSTFRTTTHVLGPARGHSHQSLAQSGGPRLKARLFSDIFNTLPQELKNYSLHSSVDFPISMDPTLGPQNLLLAQAFFNQGITQIHGFQTLEAERSFRTALLYAPQTPMIYWGLALANTIFWGGQTERASLFIQKAKELATEIQLEEKALINALALNYTNPSLKTSQRVFRYAQALKEISLTTQIDEIRALFVEAAWEYSFYGDSKLSDLGHSIESLDQILKEILVKKPLHPVHHYRIHLWDDFSREKIEQQALNSARDSGLAGPHIAHMWHMAGHSYSGLGRHQDAQRSQEISARLDHAYMSRTEVMPYEIHNYFHNNAWLVGSSLHTGKFETAKQVLIDLIKQPRHPLLNNPREEGGKEGFRNTISHAWMRYYSQFLKPLNYWNEAKDPVILSFLKEQKWTSVLFETAHTAQFMIHLESKNNWAANNLLTTLDSQFWPQKRILEANKNSPPTTSLTQVEKENLEDNINNFGEFRNLLDDLIQVYDLNGTTPPETQIETWFRLAETNRISLVLSSLLFWKLESQMNPEQIEKARKHLKNQIVELLKETKNSDSLLGLLAAQMTYANLGEIEKFLEFENEIKNHTQVAEPHSIWQNVFAHIPLFNFRIFNPSRWATPKTLSSEFKVLPEALQPGKLNLVDFGSLTFNPRRVQKFSRPGVDPTASKINLWESEISSKPLLLFFYLGEGCAHCMEQLAKLTTEFDSFKNLGVEVLAISRDSLVDLETSLGVGSSLQTGFPFSILSDSSLDLFKSFSAFDDFEELPLHGVFLLGKASKDSSRALLWRDIGPEPFMDFDFLRPEILRLLKNYKGI